MAIAMQHLQLQMHFLTSLHVFVARLLAAHSPVPPVQPVQEHLHLLVLALRAAHQDLLQEDLAAAHV